MPNRAERHSVRVHAEIRAFYAAQGTSIAMAPNAIGNTGGGQPHNNMQPYLAVSFINALTGVYPPRS